ncbi:hypothetical protein AALA98_09040 [Lachnospiraceae bacterium 45-W7]
MDQQYLSADDFALQLLNIVVSVFGDCMSMVIIMLFLFYFIG